MGPGNQVPRVAGDVVSSFQEDKDMGDGERILPVCVRCFQQDVQQVNQELPERLI